MGYLWYNMYMFKDICREPISQHPGLGKTLHLSLGGGHCDTYVYTYNIILYSCIMGPTKVNSYTCMLSWHGTRFQRFGTCSMFRTCSAHRCLHMFRTCSENPGLLFSLRKSPYGMPLADKRAQISECHSFDKMFTLLVSEKKSQNRHINSFHAPKNPDTNVRSRHF